MTLDVPILPSHRLIADISLLRLSSLGTANHGPLSPLVDFLNGENARGGRRKKTFILGVGLCGVAGFWMLDGKGRASLPASLNRICDACTNPLGLKPCMMDSGRLSGRGGCRYMRGERYHRREGCEWRGWSFCIPCGRDGRLAGRATFL